MLINKGQTPAGLHAEALGVYLFILPLCSACSTGGHVVPETTATTAETSWDQFRKNKNKIQPRE